MKILALIADPPDPPVSGTRIRNYHLWPALAKRGVDVRVLGLDYGIGGAGVPGVPCEFLPFARRPPHVRLRGAVLYSYHQYPRNPALIRRVDEVIGEWRPDVVHAEEMRMAYYLPAQQGIDRAVKQTATFHNVESDLYARTASPVVPVGKELSKRIQVKNLKRYEARVARTTDVAFTYSAVDRDRYASLYPQGNWVATKNGADIRGITPTPQPPNLSVLMVGSLGYLPNREGLLWFLDRVVPILGPAVPVTVAGSGADAELRRLLADARVRFVDHPEHLGPLYDEHAAAIVPILSGSGTRTKILEALAYDRCVVTTTKGVEGLDLSEGEGIRVADSPEAFAAAILALHDPATRAGIAHMGRDAALVRYDWSVVAEEQAEVWERCLRR